MEETPSTNFEDNHNPGVSLQCEENMNEINLNYNNSNEDELVCNDEKQQPIKGKNVQVSSHKPNDVDRCNQNLEFEEGINISDSQIYQPNTNYLNITQRQNNKEVSWQMRTILIDWLSEVSEHYLMKRSSFYLAIYILDKFLAFDNYLINKHEFQLLGITSLFIASKFEEVEPKSIVEFANTAKNIYTTANIRKFELILFKVTSKILT